MITIDRGSAAWFDFRQIKIIANSAARTQKATPPSPSPQHLRGMNFNCQTESLTRAFSRTTTNHGFDRGRVEIEACRHARSQYLRPAPRLSFRLDSDYAAPGTAARSEAGLPTSGRWHGIVRNCEAQTPCRAVRPAN